jgi:hypothetical protein
VLATSAAYAAACSARPSAVIVFGLRAAAEEREWRGPRRAARARGASAPRTHAVLRGVK